MSTSEQNFIQHFVMVLKEKMNEIYPMSEAPNEFEGGKSLAYYEVADLITECCKVFDINLKDLGIDSFNPDKLL